MAPLSVAGLIEFHVLDTGPLRLRTYCIPGSWREDSANQCPITIRKRTNQDEIKTAALVRFLGAERTPAEEPDEDCRLSCDNPGAHVQRTSDHCVNRARDTEKTHQAAAGEIKQADCTADKAITKRGWEQ